MFGGQSISSCRATIVPIRWRRMYTLAVYFYVRAGEL
jgi:hypothetical protein